MDEIRARFTAEIADRFSQAADSAAKADLIEELSDNLCLRYQENLASGMARQAAFAAALNGLGDVTELVNYLNGLSPEQSRADGPFDQLTRDMEEITQNVFDRTKSAIDEAAKRLRAGRPDPVFRTNTDAPGWADSRETFSPETPSSAEGLRGLDIQLVNGDVELLFSESAEDQVLFSGSVEELEVSRDQNGALFIRQGRTASSSSLFRRGLSSSDVELCLPCRDWDFIRVNTANGDVELNGGCRLGSVSVRTATGDISGKLASCSRLTLTTVSGDVQWSGGAESASLESVSGDLDLEGRIGSLSASTMSGDIAFTGSAREAVCSSISGDLRLEAETLPARLSVSSKSGDCLLRLPEAPPALRLSTVSGSVETAFPVCPAPDGGSCACSVTTVSGDISLEKR